MPRTAIRKGAAGSGSIRRKTMLRNGKEYNYWEARITTGFDPITGKQTQRSVSGKTQKEVAQKLREISVELDQGTYHEPCQMTLGEWMDVWTAEYLGGVKPRTAESYKCQIKNHIRPKLGNVKLSALNTVMIQHFYNELTKKGLAAKTVRIINGVLHKCLKQAVVVGYLRFNPADSCTLPRVTRKELQPLDEDGIAKFIAAVRGDEYEILMLVTLFTGMRQSEVLGLTWDCVDFSAGTVLINKQLLKQQDEHDQVTYVLATTKNGKGRKLTPADTVMDLLRKQKAIQDGWKSEAGSSWEDSNLVFTNALGGHLMHHTVYKHFKRVAVEIGFPDTRFHDLRHSYAIAAIKSGDDIKTVQGNLGHATASFTLDVYGHLTDQMKRESARRMERFIQSVSSQ